MVKSLVTRHPKCTELDILRTNLAGRPIISTGQLYMEIGNDLYQEAIQEFVYDDTYPMAHHVEAWLVSNWKRISKYRKTHK